MRCSATGQPDWASGMCCSTVVWDGTLTVLTAGGVGGNTMGWLGRFVRRLREWLRDASRVEDDDGYLDGYDREG